MGNENTTALVNPAGNMELAMEVARNVKARADEILAQIEAATAAVTAENFASKDTAAEVKRLGDIVEDLRDSGKRLVAKVCEATEAQRILTAIDSRLWSYSNKVDPLCAYAKLSAAMKALKGKVAEFKSEVKSTVPVRAAAIVLYATDAGIAKLADDIKAGKVKGVEGYKFAPDEATEKKALKILNG